MTVDTAAMRPLSLSYDYDGEQVQVGILGIAPLAGHVRLFDKNAYAGYEFIDFRVIFFYEMGTPGRHIRNRMAARCVFGQTVITNLRRLLRYTCCRKTS